MPDTWIANSKAVLGYVAPQTPVTERFVVAHVLQKWMDRGYTPYQIGLLYNGGELKEKRCDTCKVPYDSGKYARNLVSNFTLIVNAQD